MKRRLLYLVVDLSLGGIATILALLLRDNFTTSADRLQALLPYFLLTLLTMAVVLLASGAERSIWRVSGMGDYLRVLACVAVGVLATVALAFVINRLDGVARALPLIQALLMAFLLVGARVAMRLRHARRSQFPLTDEPLEQHETVVVIGFNVVTELYIRAALEFAPQRVRIAGIVSSKERHRGRRFRQYPILGTPEEIDEILRTLSVHGVVVDRIVVTSPFAKLSPSARRALLALEKSSAVVIDFFAERIGLQTPNALSPCVRGSETGPQANNGSSNDTANLRLSVAELEAIANRPYFRAKRAVDVLFALCLASLAVPLMVLVGLLVAFDIGTPVIFWQQRPGVRGAPFKLYKFRTMSSAHDDNGLRRSDAERLSLIGQFLRRTRLDELPQLYNIFVGEMSFVGPRPLLPVDQAVPLAPGRLLVRPGLTGLAQVIGGRHIPAEDKSAIDVWYACHASLLLDLRILMRTIPTVLFGEHVDTEAVRVALHAVHSRLARQHTGQTLTLETALGVAESDHQVAGRSLAS